jgi:hypothetical protein
MSYAKDCSHLNPDAQRLNDMIYDGLTPGGSSPVHIYTSTTHRITQTPHRIALQRNNVANYKVLGRNVFVTNGRNK